MTDPLDILTELERRAELGGGEERLKRHHDAGKLTAPRYMPHTVVGQDIVKSGEVALLKGLVPPADKVDTFLCTHRVALLSERAQMAQRTRAGTDRQEPQDWTRQVDSKRVHHGKQEE